MSNKHNVEIKKKELDLIDLLGVLIKRRFFIFWFVLIFVVLSFSLILYREYKKVKIEKEVNYLYVLSSDSDFVYSTYMLAAKSSEIEEYESFVKKTFYPDVINAPKFRVIIKNSPLKVIYAFDNDKDMKNFWNRHTSYIYNFNKLRNSISKMSDESIAVCQHLLSSQQIIGKEVYSLFKNSKDWKSCNIFGYYFYSTYNLMKDTLGEKIAISTYMSFLKNFSFFDNLSKYDKEINLKDKNLSKKKLLKYFILLLMLSIMSSVVLAFVLEFWVKNKDRLKKYW